MKRATAIAILGALVAGMLAIGAGARARAQIPAADASNRHPTRRELHATAGPPGESQRAPSTFSVEVNESLLQPVVKPEAVDWGNPYDVMLHGIKPGKTRDMR